MNLFINTRTKRGITVVMLLVWLFAVASGVANACLLETPGHHRHSSEEEYTSAAREAPEIVIENTEAYASPHNKDSDLSQAPCQRVCDDGVQTLLKHPSAIDLTDIGQATFVAIVWPAPAQLTSLSIWAADLSLPATGPPIRVRFSRLAL